MVTVKAPAKINLTLEVLGRRPDGYHEIRSIMQTLNLCDVLHFTEATAVNIHSRAPGWDAGLSLVSKAVDVVQKATGHLGGADIEVEKNIPLTAGLGGDSSDAAAVLCGLNRLWSLGLAEEKLLELAAQLGSDVSFFVHGGTCLVGGRGERVTSLPAIPPQRIILVNPNVRRFSGKTALMYSRLTPAHFTDGGVTERLVQDLRAGLSLTSAHLVNTFENVAFEVGQELAVYRSHIVKLGTPNVHLAGSGPAMFIVPENAEQAAELYTRITDQGMEAYMLDTGSCE